MPNFEADDETLRELEKLREFYRLHSVGFTIRRALAIASMLRDYSDPDGTVTVVKPGTGGQETVKLSQRYAHKGG